MSIYIKQALLDGREQDIVIANGIIETIIPCNKAGGETLADAGTQTLIDAKGKAVIPGLFNMHTHAAMTLMRGYADDMPLKEWLENKIWPAEKKLTDEDVYWGTKLACIEMIKSGTTTFFDMYHKPDAIENAVTEMGLRAWISEACFDFFREDLAEKSKQRIISRFRKKPPTERITYALGPHAIYTVSGALLKWAADFAQDNNVFMHLHLAETEQETADSIRDFSDTPVRYLNKLGVLSPKLIIAHGLYVDDEEIMMLADTGVAVVHNPASNMKLGSGGRFKFEEMKRAGVRIALGTDGCASSNNLDMIETMKLASLLGKAWRKDPTALTCSDIYKAATTVPAEILGIKAGKIETGYLADLCLIDLNQPAFTPNFNLVSNLVYSANSSCVDTVICNGEILMANRKIAHEKEILEEAAVRAENLTLR
ncbi:MAG: amidohydrolase [Tannerella sp.]|jgi:5-methylthioadenosine/S-adenosylhomocysteine deaminase|nr:amidohydrolase [Tannerella sp.]